MSKKKTKKRFANKKQVKIRNKRLVSIIIIGLVLVVGGIFFNDLMNKGNSAEKSKVKQAVTQSDPSILRGGENRPTLSPAKFTGNVARAYQIAEQNPILLDSMYCYCNCKETIGHKSLLSCYADNHAVSCGICQDQAFFALSKYKSGMDIIEVRKAVDAKFWRPLS
jgi:hypothetical protein